VKVRSIAGSNSGYAAEAATAVATGTCSMMVPYREQLLRALPKRTALLVFKSVAVNTTARPGWVTSPHRAAAERDVRERGDQSIGPAGPPGRRPTLPSSHTVRSHGTHSNHTSAKCRGPQRSVNDRALQSTPQQLDRRLVELDEVARAVCP
jgi:hypothetical protein